jgi:hypothetical protein
MLLIQRALTSPLYTVARATTIRTPCDVGFRLYPHKRINVPCAIQFKPHHGVFYSTHLPYPPTFTRAMYHMNDEWITKCSYLHRGNGIRTFPRRVSCKHGRLVFQKKITPKSLPHVHPYWTLRTYIVFHEGHMFLQTRYIWLFESNRFKTNRVRNSHEGRQRLLSDVDSTGEIRSSVVRLGKSMCAARKKHHPVYNASAIMAADMIMDANNTLFLLEINSYASMSWSENTQSDIDLSKLWIMRDAFTLMGLQKGRTSKLDECRGRSEKECRHAYSLDNTGSFVHICMGNNIARQPLP